MPVATKRRNTVAIVLAAAAVLVVPAGVLYGVDRADPAETGSERGDIWGAAVVTIAQEVAPPQGWQTVRVYWDGAFPGSATPDHAVTFTAAERARIEQAVAPFAPVEWGGTSAIDSCTNRRIPSVTVGQIVDKGDHREVAVQIAYNCENGWMPKYRLAKVDGVWKVTDLVGLPTGVAPLDCPKTSASPAGAC